MTIGTHLKELREKRNMTQADVALALGKTADARSQIWEWEHGEKIPQIDSLKALAKVFQVSLKSLFKFYE